MFRKWKSVVVFLIIIIIMMIIITMIIMIINPKIKRLKINGYMCTSAQITTPKIATLTHATNMRGNIKI